MKNPRARLSIIQADATADQQAQMRGIQDNFQRLNDILKDGDFHYEFGSFALRLDNFGLTDPVPFLFHRIGKVITLQHDDIHGTTNTAPLSATPLPPELLPNVPGLAMNCFALISTNGQLRPGVVTVQADGTLTWASPATGGFAAPTTIAANSFSYLGA